jgi:CO dehydrogenase maturation factor
MNPTVNDIPEKLCVDFRNIKLLVMGGVRKGGAGCACPESVLLKNLLSEVILTRGEAVIVDMEAGIEHLGRATAESIDMMLIIVEPGSRSIVTAAKIITMGEEIGIRHFRIICNKIQTAEQKDWTEKQFPQELILGTISYHDIIRNADLSQKPLIDLMDKKIKGEFDTVYKSIISTKPSANRA